MFDALRARVRRPRREETVPDSATSLLDDDPALTLLSEDLKGLGSLRVAPAPRERTLALLRAEVRRQDARGAFKATRARTFSRLAYGGAALVVAVSLGVFALAGGLDKGDDVANNSTTSDSLVVGTTTDTVSPDTTGSSLPGSVTTHSTQVPVTTVPPTTQSSADHSATTDTRPTAPAPPTSTRPRTATTVAPGTTTTTGSAVMTSEDREESARTVVLAVAYKITSGALEGVDTYVASSAKTGLAQMIASLERPSTPRILSVEERTTGIRVHLEITDNVSDGQGGLKEVHRRFYFETLVDDDDGALITSIYAG